MARVDKSAGRSGADEAAERAAAEAARKAAAEAARKAAAEAAKKAAAEAAKKAAAEAASKNKSNFASQPPPGLKRPATEWRAMAPAEKKQAWVDYQKNLAKVTGETPILASNKGPANVPNSPPPGTSFPRGEWNAMSPSDKQAAWGGFLQAQKFSQPKTPTLPAIRPQDLAKPPTGVRIPMGEWRAMSTQEKTEVWQKFAVSTRQQIPAQPKLRPEDYARPPEESRIPQAEWRIMTKQDKTDVILSLRSPGPSEPAGIPPSDPSRSPPNVTIPPQERPDLSMAGGQIWTNDQAAQIGDPSVIGQVKGNGTVAGALSWSADQMAGGSGLGVNSNNGLTVGQDPKAWNNWCLAFVSTAYGRQVPELKAGSAIDAYGNFKNAGKIVESQVIPQGAPVFFKATSANGGFGHIAIATGQYVPGSNPPDPVIRTTGWNGHDGITEMPLSKLIALEGKNSYLGYGMVPGLGEPSPVAVAGGNNTPVAPSTPGGLRPSTNGPGDGTGGPFQTTYGPGGVAGGPTASGPAGVPPGLLAPTPLGGVKNPTPQQAAILAAADRISQQAQVTQKNPTPNEMQILFKAAEIRTGVPASLLKAIAYGESFGNAYPDGVPRQFIDGNLAPGIKGHEKWPENLLGVNSNVTLGDDREFGSNTFGIGLMQITGDADKIRAALDPNSPTYGQPVQLQGGGKPYFGWEGTPVTMDVQRAMNDPYYNIMVAAQLLQHKVAIYSDPKNPNAVSWIPQNPQTPEEWALVGSTYQTMGGYGPGGGATDRILTRMTDPNADAAAFVSAGPELDFVGGGDVS
jgi:predicted Fe-S protein YdhL (DUF1289 family)